MHEPLPQQRPRPGVRAVRGLRARRRARAGSLRGRRRRHRAGDAARGGPAGRARARREPARLRPQPAGLRPGVAHRDAARVVQEVVRGLRRVGILGRRRPRRAGRDGRAPVTALGDQRADPRGEPCRRDDRVELLLRQAPPHPRHRRAEEARQAHGRPEVDRDDGPHRAGRRLRRRRGPHQGGPERRRHLEQHRRQAVHHLGRDGPVRGRVPRACRSSSSPSSTSSTSTPASSASATAP